MLESAVRWFAVTVVLAGCTAEGVEELVGEPAAPGERPRGIYIRVDGPELEAQAIKAAEAPRARIIYMNRNGGTYTPGSDDSATNRSSIPYGTSVVPPWDVSEAGWQEVMDCMRELWAEFDVEITDVEPPPDVDYIESVVAGRPQNVGMGSGVGGVSPFYCGVIERSIVFTFAEVYGTSYRDICETAAQETAHSFGLDHEYMCEDPMTYLYGCGEKSFQDVDAPCGEYSSRSCSCGGSTQNSVQMLLAYNGPADRTAPLVAILDPSDGATVAPGFEVVVDASDDVGVKRVELYVDDQLADTLTAPPWTFTSDPALPEGDHAIRTVAYDAKNTAEAAVDVTLSSDPPDDGDPPDDDPPGGGDDDDDPLGPDNTVTGGCATAPGAAGGAGGALLWLGLALFARRRRPAKRAR